MQKSILIVEDNHRLANAIREALMKEGYEAVASSCAREANAHLGRQAVDVILLDLGLPDCDGMDLLASFRKQWPTLPVLVITARDAVDCRVAGLDAGATDYLIKPIEMAELLARVRKVFRETRPLDTLLCCGPIRMDPSRGEVHLQGELLDLSPLEFKLLRFLLENKERIVSRGMLATNVWNVESRSSPMDNVIEVAVSRLREKLQGGNKTPAVLHTVRGVGYLLKCPES